jgi:hypothetical protein
VLDMAPRKMRSTDSPLQETIYKIILVGTALDGQNCWGSMEPLNLSSRAIKLVF